jgi:Bacteriocin-protection, YdeI or OmpD-Associated
MRIGPRVEIPLRFDPADAWGRRDRYHVTGIIEGSRFRGPLVFRDGTWLIQRGRKSPGAALLEDGQMVAVEIWPEGPQIDELATDITEALEARPGARAAFEALAQFYRKGWLRWIDATKRRPELRAERIAEMLLLLEGGHKEHP